MNATADPRIAPLALTRLTTFGDVLATKTWSPGEDASPVCTPYGSAKHFRGELVVFRSIEDLHEELKSALSDPHRFYVRGAIRTGVNAERMRRLLRPELAEDGNVVAAATLEPCARSVATIDTDLNYLPDGVDPVADPDGAVDYLLGLLSAGSSTTSGTAPTRGSA